MTSQSLPEEDAPTAEAVSVQQNNADLTEAQRQQLAIEQQGSVQQVLNNLQFRSRKVLWDTLMRWSVTNRRRRHLSDLIGGENYVFSQHGSSLFRKTFDYADIDNEDFSNFAENIVASGAKLGSIVQTLETSTLFAEGNTQTERAIRDTNEAKLTQLLMGIGEIEEIDGLQNWLRRGDENINRRPGVIGNITNEFRNNVRRFANVGVRQVRNPDRLLLPGFTPAELEAFEEATQYDFVAHVPDNTDENQDNLEALTNAADIYQNIDDHSDDWENIRGAASNNTRNQLRFQQINDLLNGPAGLERMLHNANRTINTERTRRPGFFTLDRWRGNRANADSQIILDEQRELVRMQTALQRLPEGHPDRVVLESDITLQEQQIKNAEEAFRESALALPVNIAALPPDAEYNVLVAGPPVATQLARLEYLQRQIDTLKVEQVNLQEVSNTERDVSREGRGEQLQKEQDLRAQLTLLIDALHEVDNPALPPAIFTAIEGINVSHFTMNDLEIALSGFNITIPGSSISALPPGLSTMNPIDYTMNPIDYRDTRTVFDWISDDIHETRFHHTTLQEYNGRVTPDRALDALLQYRFRDNPNFVDVFKQSLLGNEQGIVQDWVKKDPRARRGLQWLLSHVPLLGTVFRA